MLRDLSLPRTHWDCPCHRAFALRISPVSNVLYLILCDSCPSFTPWTKKMPSLIYQTQLCTHMPIYNLIGVQPDRCRSIPLYISNCNNFVLVHLLSVWHSHQNISSIYIGPVSLLSSLVLGIMTGPQAPCSQKRILSMFLKTQ